MNNQYTKQEQKELERAKKALRLSYNTNVQTSIRHAALHAILAVDNKQFDEARMFHHTVEFGYRYGRLTEWLAVSRAKDEGRQEVRNNIKSALGII